MMGDRAIQPKLPWANKFQRPTPEVLVSQCESKQLSQLVRAARQEIVSLAGVSETLSWLGVPWRWSFVYTLEESAQTAESPHAAVRAHPLAYMIPDPQKPQVAVPMSGQLVEALPMRRLKRFARDGIVHCRIVGEVYWPSWDFSARTQLDEIMDLVVRKHRMVAALTQSVVEGA
jgi:hypothetical protein